jgi:hypothetical protein
VISVIERDSDVRVGLMVLAAHEARLVEWGPRRTEEVRRIELGDVAGDERELRGPSASHPRGAPGAGPGSHSGQQRDLHARRLEQHRAAVIEEFAQDAVPEIERHGWPFVLILGDPRLTHAAAGALRPRGVPVQESPRILGWLTPAELAREVSVEVERALEGVVAGRRVG